MKQKKENRVNITSVTVNGKAYAASGRGAVKAFETLRDNVKNAVKALRDDIKEKWDWIQEKLSQFSKWLGSIFKTAWTNNFGIFGNVLKGFLKSAKDVIRG